MPVNPSYTVLINLCGICSQFSLCSVLHIRFIERQPCTIASYYVVYCRYVGLCLVHDLTSYDLQRVLVERHVLQFFPSSDGTSQIGNMRELFNGCFENETVLLTHKLENCVKIDAGIKRRPSRVFAICLHAFKQYQYGPIFNADLKHCSIPANSDPFPLWWSPGVLL